jgi:hypothetical protein
VARRSNITTDLESRELEGALGDEHAVVVEPPLRPELLGVGAPQELHPAHLVRLVVHHVPFVDSVAIRQRVVRKAALDILQHQHPPTKVIQPTTDVWCETD